MNPTQEAALLKSAEAAAKRWFAVCIFALLILFPGELVEGAESPVCAVPNSVAMSRGAGEGMMLFVKVRLEDGQEFPFALDTGSPSTSVPISLEPKLGKRLGSRRFHTLDSRHELEHLYVAPKLYLGNTRLMTGSRVGAWESFGVLGMDCLRHYCVQLDFQSRKVRFLEPNEVKTGELGKPFVLTISGYATIKHAALFQSRDTELLIDTGCPFDGYLEPRLFRQAVREHGARSLPFFKEGRVQGTAPGMALFAECVWEHEKYTNLILGKGLNLLGLRFLGRHLVTLDFPAGVMYLKRINESATSPAPHHR